MPPVLPPMPPTVHRHWAPDVAPYKYADDRDWDEYRPRQLPAEHHPKPAPKASRTTTKAPSNKRAPATDAVGSEPPKKRRKDESAPVPPVPMPTPTNSKRPDAHKPEERVPVQTDLSTLPVSSLVSYLVKHDIIPPIHPSPYTAQPALAPSILLNPPSHTPPPPPPHPRPPSRSSQSVNAAGQAGSRKTTPTGAQPATTQQPTTSQSSQTSTPSTAHSPNSSSGTGTPRPCVNKTRSRALSGPPSAHASVLCSLRHQPDMVDPMPTRNHPSRPSLKLCFPDAGAIRSLSP
ncbi:hypothetical protein FRC08_013139 [Ceratobasidium sp. 394]|nr:hypothetical protein FRC08_013139 [Ceratobasidium sp. 394]